MPAKNRAIGSDQSEPTLSQQALQVLLALAGGDKHGWAILRDVERFTDGHVQLSAGTLYGLIKRLREQGLIEESRERPPLEWDDPRRRYWRITAEGRRNASAEIDRLERMVSAARRRELRGAEGR